MSTHLTSPLASMTLRRNVASRSIDTLLPLATSAALLPLVLTSCISSIGTPYLSASRALVIWRARSWTWAISRENSERILAASGPVASISVRIACLSAWMA